MSANCWLPPSTLTVVATVSVVSAGTETVSRIIGLVMTRAVSILRGSTKMSNNNMIQSF